MPGSFQLLRDPPLELLLLLAGARYADDAEQHATLDRLAAQDPDWSLVLSLARRHHVTTLLYRGLHRAGWPAVPLSICVDLEHALAANFRRNVALVRQAKIIIRALQDRAIRVLPFKGVFLAQTVYGHLSSREARDIDLLVGREDVGRSGAVLDGIGFEALEQLDQQQVFRHPATRVDIDLHWHIAPDFFPVGFGFDSLWEGAADARLDGLEYRGPGPEDLLLLLAVQLAKDCWERRLGLAHLLKVNDVAELLRRFPNLDWNRITGQAGRQGLARVLHFALALATDLYAAPIPPEVKESVGRDRGALILARQACALPALADLVPPPDRNDLLDLPLRVRQFVFYLRLRERQRDRWSYPAQVAVALARKFRETAR